MIKGIKARLQPPYENNIPRRSASGLLIVGKLYVLDTIHNVKASIYSSSKKTHSNALDAEFDMHAHWLPNSINDLTFGVNAILTSMSGTAFAKRKYALETALFVQDVISLFDGKLTLVPGARFTVAPGIQGSGTIYMGTPKFSVKYNPVESTALRFSYGAVYYLKYGPDSVEAVMENGKEITLNNLTVHGKLENGKLTLRVSFMPGKMQIPVTEIFKSK